MQAKKTLLISLIFLCGSFAYPGHLWAVNGDQRIALSAITYGMAGATTALPEDVSTILLNPAGISSLEMNDVRFDMGFSLLNPPRSINGQNSDSNLYFLPTGGAIFQIKPKLRMGMVMSGIAGFGVDVPDFNAAAAGNQAVATQKEMFVFSPGGAYKFNDKISIGASLNICNQSLALSNPQFTLHQNRQFGFGLTIGTSYKISSAWMLGISYISEKNIEEHEFNTTEGTFKVDMDDPTAIAFGVAFQPFSDLVIEANIKHILFSGVRDTVIIQRPANYTGNVPEALQFGWDDQTVFALGVRKKVGDTTIVRAGLNYGQSPIDAEDVNQNLGAIAITEMHLSFGLSRHVTKNLIVNAAYTHGFKNKLTSPTFPNNQIEIEQHWLHLQVSYAF